MRSKSTAPLKAALIVNMASVLVTLAIFFALFWWWAVPADDHAQLATGAADRLAIWGGLVLWPALLLMGQVMGVMMARGRSRAFNPITDEESLRQRIAQRVLSNSVEQTMIFLPALAAWCVLSPPAMLAMAGPATAIFVAGRLLFWIGYRIHPYARAPGMAMTWTISALLLAGGVMSSLGG